MIIRENIRSCIRVMHGTNLLYLISTRKTATVKYSFPS